MIFGSVGLHLRAHYLIRFGHSVDRASTVLSEEVENRIYAVGFPLGI